MSLKLYKQKRHFNKTIEPKAQRSKKKASIFVIQKHDASHLHYDFRLTMEGVLKSWAVPKGPSLDPAVKRLAIQVEDHPLEYAHFEGNIPKGEYGGGTVMIWDHGTWASKEDPIESYEKGNMHFTLKGTKLKGDWKLVRIKKNDSKPQWLLIKIEDDISRKQKEYDILEKKPHSAESGKTLEEIGDNKKLATLPETFKPELATLVKSIPKEANWIHEIKYDGYRILTYVKNTTIQLLSRNGHDWTKKFPGIVLELKKLKIKNTIIDGEIVVLNEKGISIFHLLQNALKSKDSDHLHYFVFDLPFNNGEDLTSVPLIKRKAVLKKVIGKKHSLHLHYSDHQQGYKKNLLEKACELKLEGLVSKRKESLYQQFRTTDWVKTKCKQRQEFIIVGFTKPQKARKHFGSLLLAYYDKNKELIYAGHVGTGFTKKSLSEIGKTLNLLVKSKSNLHLIPNATINKKTIWVKPKLIAEVEFIEWTKEGRLRHPSFKGLREDKRINEVIKEMPSQLTHPDKILYSKTNITKLDVANYYLAVADKILPYIKKRPMVMVRCPRSVSDQCFYQKHWEKVMPKEFDKVKIKEKEKTGDYALVNNEKSLLTAAQLNAIELHPWSSKKDKLKQPDMIIFDLDPAPGIRWKTLVKAAVILRERLQSLNLTSFAKLTGGKGIHLVVPIRRQKDFLWIKQFTKALAEKLSVEFPNLFTANMSKQKRKGKIFIDYLRNEYGSTAISPYSLRADLVGSIALPISWGLLEKSAKKMHYTLKTYDQYLKDFPHDPWADFWLIRQSLSLKQLNSF